MLKHNKRSDMAVVEELVEKKIVVTPANILYADSTKETGYIRIHFAVADGVADKVVEILARR